MGFQVSPGVVTSEIDLTTVVPAVSTSTGAFGGTFQWGPIGVATSVSNEIELVKIFGKPDVNTAISFFTCANFLAYGSDLRISRAYEDEGTYSAGYPDNEDQGAQGGHFLIKNENEFFNDYMSSTTEGPWIARYAGALGNSLEVQVYDGDGSDGSWDSWDYAPYFDSEPGTSGYCSDVNSGLRDEFHLVVIDKYGKFTGNKGAILETFPYLSKASDAKDVVGNSIYYVDVLYRKSKYIYGTARSPEYNTSQHTWGKSAQTVFDDSTSYFTLTNHIDTATFLGGADGNIDAAAATTAYDVFKDPETIDISLLITGDPEAITLTDVVDIADTRKDCVAFISPSLDATQTGTSGILTYRNDTNISSSYVVMDSGWKYQYDKYNDVYRWIPLNADIAGLCARTDQLRDPWFSPAGLSRGQIKNVVKLSFNPSKTDRDNLYKAGINPVVSFPGEGIILFGDKTLLNRPSAFDRINVRRLFIVLEKAIARAARSSLFEFNDEFTRAQFVSIVEPFLRDVKGRRGVYDYKVVCDVTNNTPEVIDTNRFVGDIYVKPARSINFIQLNFVAVRTGVAFDEIVGKF